MANDHGLFWTISMNFYGRAMIYGQFQEKQELTTMAFYRPSYSSKSSAKLLNFVKEA